MIRNYFCLCCGYKTLEEKPPGTHEICEICFWQDDSGEGGANHITLRQAKNNFKNFGVSDLRFKDRLRKPTKDDIRHDDWETLFWPGEKNKSIYTVLPERKTETDHYIINEAGKPAHKEVLYKPAIYIIEGNDDMTAFMNKYTIEGKWIGDTWHFNFEEAKHQAEFEFDEPIKKWIEIPESIEDLIGYVLKQISKKD